MTTTFKGSIITALLIVSSFSMAQNNNAASTLPAGVGEQPTFTQQIESTLTVEKSEPTKSASSTESTTEASQKEDTTVPDEPTYTPQERTAIGILPVPGTGAPIEDIKVPTTELRQPEKRSIYQLRTPRYYKPYQPSSLPHFQYRANQSADPQSRGLGVSALIHGRNPNFLITKKEVASATGGKPIDENKYNEKRFQRVPKALRQHPSWQGGHFLHFPEKKNK